MIHVDALRHDYVTEEDMPFLYSLASTGIAADVIPPFGFEPDGAYLTGREPEEYEGGVHFVYSPETSCYGFARFLPALMDRLGPYVSFAFRRFFVERLVRHFARTARQKKQTYIGRIPFHQLPRFDLCEQEYAFEPGALNGLPTLYDQLRKGNKTWFFHGAPKHPVGVDRVVQRALLEIDGSADFIFLFIADLDAAGHQYGPESCERRACAKKVDAGLRRIYEHITALYEQTDCLVFGDHGMVAVERGVNIAAALKTIPFSAGKDYTVFLDSTFARFWIHNEAVRGPLQELLAGIEGGTWISEQDRTDYAIRWKSRRFGDLIWWVDAGYEIHPDYWHFRDIKKGMHGYRREVRDNHAAALFHSTAQPFARQLSEPAAMVDLFATVLDSLELPLPAGARGRPLRSLDHEDA